jgi:hypothetical protein
MTGGGDGGMGEELREEDLWTIAADNYFLGAKYDDSKKRVILLLCRSSLK